MTAKKRKTAKMAPTGNFNQILTRLKKAHPDAKLDLDFSNTLELLIALILAAQARDDLVNQVTPELFKANRTAADYAKLPLAGLETQIGKINFYRNKAKSIHNCCSQLVERFGGTHHGYFLPHEGPNNIAVALFSFPSLATYEDYRQRSQADAECQSAYAFAQTTRCIVSYERSFMRPIWGEGATSS